MKKLFMIAASIGLAMGVVGCQKGPDDGARGNGTETAMGLSITLPNTGGATRAEFDPIDGTEEESTVNTMELFVFDGDGNAPADAAKAYKKWSTIPGTDFTQGQGSSSNTYTLTNPFTTIAGNVKVWIGINLPDGFATGITNETELKAGFETLANLVDHTDGSDMVMFSNGASQNLVILPIENTPAAGLETNTVDVAVYRAVAKVIATRPSTLSPAAWRISWPEADDDIHLQYTPVHWRLFQRATSSYVAPNYDVPTYNNSTMPADRPKTYAPTAASTISTYAMDAIAATRLKLVNTPTGGTESTALNADPEASAYVAENSGSTSGNATYAFITTTIKPDFEATWDTATENFKWTTGLSTPYGNGAADPAKKNVYFIRYQDKNYITSTQDNWNAIVNGLAAKLKYTLDATNSTPDPIQQGEYIKINADDFPAAIGLECYVYWDGYVHFPVYFNKADANRYDLLRNQFVHLKLTGLNNNNNTFPGYPGQDPAKNYTVGDPTPTPTTGVPAIPADPTVPVNNPYVVDPTKPLDAQSTVMLVEVEVKPWHYKTEDVKLN